MPHQNPPSITDDLADEMSRYDKIIELTIQKVASLGVASFSVKDVCDELGVSHSLINHHYGGKHGLVAAALPIVYARHVAGSWRLVDESKRSPEEAIETWIRVTTQWNVANPGWAVMLNYPTASLETTNASTPEQADILSRWGQYNLVRLLGLVVDLRHNRTTVTPYDKDRGTIDDIGATQVEIDVAATIAFSALGVYVWSVGRHLPSKDLPQVHELGKHAVDFHIKYIIRHAKNFDGTL